MSLTLQQLLDRQKYINASEIAWVIHTFGDASQVPFMPAYCKDKTDYQFYHDHTATPEQIEKLQKAKANTSTQEGSRREQPLFNEHLSKYFERQPIQDGYVNGILRATPDLIVNLKQWMEGVCLTDDIVGTKTNMIETTQGLLEIKLSGQAFKKNQLIDYHKWQVQQQLYCAGLKWGVLAFFETETPDNRSPVKSLDLEFIFLDEQKLAVMHDASQKAMSWIDKVKRGVVPVYINTNNKIDKIYANIIR